MRRCRLPFFDEFPRGIDNLPVWPVVTPVFPIRHLGPHTRTRRLKAATALAGNQVAFAFPADRVGELISARIQIVTTATVGARQFVWRWRDSAANTLYESALLSDITASLTRSANIVPNGAAITSTAAQVGQFLSSLPSVEWQTGDDLLVRDVATIDVNDTIEFMGVYTREWNP